MKESMYQILLNREELKLESRFKCKGGYRIAVFNHDIGEGEIRKVVYITYQFWSCGYLDEGWSGEEHNIYSYLKDFNQILGRLKNKTAKRYFLKLIRNFPLFHNTTYGDFLSKSGIVDWNKVRQFHLEHQANGKIYI